MLKKLVVSISIMYAAGLSAQNQIIVDLYGDNEHAAQVIKKYSRSIQDMVASVDQEIKDKGDVSSANRARKKALIARIKKEEHYAYVDLNTIYYPDTKDSFTTIEVVKKNQANRLKYVQNTSGKKIKKAKSKSDIVNQMINYESLAMQLAMKNKLPTGVVDCPVYHCSFGFHHPELKPYLSIFNEGILSKKKLIVSALKNGNEERRGAAAFLLGHLHDPQEIISLLLPYVNDPSASVRNDVMRVIGGTLQKAKISLDLKPFLQLLNSPVTTDRNKALFILLLSAYESNQAKIDIIQHSERLLDILRLKQPDNHEIAYQLLKKISGKSYGEYDINSWKQWLDSSQKRNAKNNLK